MIKSRLVCQKALALGNQPLEVYYSESWGALGQSDFNRRWQAWRVGGALKGLGHLH